MLTSRTVTDHRKVAMLLSKGNYKEINRAEIRHILVYNLVDNPISQIHLIQPLTERIKEIYLSGSDEPSLIGWPVQFVEEFVVFYDIQGTF